jgi:hypothetical protein
MPNDPLATQQNPFAPTQGPFSNVLQSGLVPGEQQTPDKPSGFVGTTGKLAFLGTKFLEGFQRGRLLSYMGQEAKKASETQKVLAAYNSTIENADTPDKREAAIKARDQFVLQSLHQEVGGEGGGKGKKPQKSPDEYPSRGGKVMKQGTASGEEGIGGQVKGFFGNLIKNLGGPNLPESGPVDFDKARAELQKINEMPSGESMQKQVHDQATALVQKIQGKEGYTTRDLYRDPDYQKVAALAERYLPPHQAQTLLQSMDRSTASQSELDVEAANKIKLEAAKLNLDEDKAAVEYGHQLDAIASGGAIGGGGAPGSTPPNVRSMGTYQGPPEVTKPIPEEQKTTPQKVGDRFTPNDTHHLFGGEMRIPPRYIQKYGAPSVVYAQKGNDVVALYNFRTPAGQSVTTGADGRFFNRDQAEKEGWTMQASRPVRILPPRPDLRIGEDPKNKNNFLWYEVDPTTHKFVPAKGDDGKPIVARVTKDQKTTTLSAFRMANQVLTTQDTSLKNISKSYEMRRSVVRTNAMLSKKEQDAEVARLDDAQTREESLVKQQTKAHLDILGRSLGIENMINAFGDRVGQPDQEGTMNPFRDGAINPFDQDQEPPENR